MAFWTSVQNDRGCVVPQQSAGDEREERFWPGDKGFLDRWILIGVTSTFCRHSWPALGRPWHQHSRDSVTGQRERPPGAVFLLREEVLVIRQ